MQQFKAPARKKQSRRSVVQTVEMSTTNGGAKAAYDVMRGWFGGCTDARVQLISTYDVDRVGDDATLLVLRSWKKPENTMVAGVARTGRATTITFTSGTVTKVYNNSWIRQDGSSYNQPRTQVLAQVLTATPVMSSNGKQITGWDLTSNGSTKVISDTGIPAVPKDIDYVASYFSPAGLAVNTLASTTVTPGDLQVTGNGVTKDLPNSPVEVPAV